MIRAIDNYKWAEKIIHELIRAGVSHFFMAPGSRSAPLSMVIVRLAKVHPSLCCHHHFDERSLAFAALGVVKTTHQPVVVLTSSGTAVANLLPAMVEASQLNLPLIALTADRPQELINVGANQAIEQPGLFSHFARQCLNLPVAEGCDVARELLQLQLEMPGPVHINVPFCEPLYPELEDISPVGDLPPVLWVNPVDKSVESRCLEGQQCIIVAGALSQPDAAQVLAFAEQFQLPVFADSGSQLRQNKHPLVVKHAHYLCLHAADRLNGVSHVVQFGGRVVSKAVNRWLENFAGDYWLVSEGSDCLDPTGKAHPLNCLASQWQNLFQVTMSRQTELVTALQQQDAVLAKQIYAEASRQYSELQLVHKLSELLPPSHAVFLGNSLAIRLFDQVAVARPQSNRVYANRGASGIDGLIATAAGISLGSGQPLTVLLGDLSTLYDLNSLYWLQHLNNTCVLIVLNNDGGQIFKMLPAAKQTDVFHQAFEQSHGLNFEAFAAGFNLNYSRADNCDAFEKQYLQACTIQGATIIEATLPGDAFILHQQHIIQQLHD